MMAGFLRGYDVEKCVYLYMRGSELWMERSFECGGPHRAMPRWNFTERDVYEFCEEASFPK